MIEALYQQVQELQARVAALEAGQKNAFQEPQECQERRCEFYTHYLSLGSPELTHEGYHAAEVKCATYQSRCMAWHEAHPDEGDRNCPWCRLADEWERRIRA